MLLTVLALGVLSGSVGALAWVLLGGSVWAAVLIYGLIGSLGVVLSATALRSGLSQKPALAAGGPLSARRHDRRAHRQRGPAAVPSRPQVGSPGARIGSR